MMRVTLGVVLASGMAVTALAQSGPQARRGTAESSLVGVALYDTALRVVNLYGSPDEIQGLTIGQGNGAGGGPGTGATGATGGGATSSSGAGAVTAVEENRPGVGGLYGNPFGNQSEFWRQVRPGDSGSEQEARSGGAGRPGAGGPGGTGAPGGGGAASGGSGTQIVRWVYKRGSSRYAFVFDRFSRVVQIEAVGMNDSKPRTRRAICFGSSFASVIKAYIEPDSYELIGDTVIVRFLANDRVAFRMQRLRPNGTHVVTGIVVAAAAQ
ncbi:MAG: hypothetical protein ACK4NQ_08760 [Fimbriimonadaceae bacterium]